jgi:hypothetical protein
MAKDALLTSVDFHKERNEVFPRPSAVKEGDVMIKLEFNKDK